MDFIKEKAHSDDGSIAIHSAEDVDHESSEDYPMGRWRAWSTGALSTFASCVSHYTESISLVLGAWLIVSCSIGMV